MSFTNQKITDAEIAANGVQSQPNKLTGSALENKKVFDKLVAEAVKVKFNALIDELLAQTAAGQIGVSVTGLTATTVGAALLELLTAMQDITQGSVADGSITHAKLSSSPPAVQNDNLSGILPEYVGIKMGTTIPTTSDIGEGEIWLKYTEEEDNG